MQLQQAHMTDKPFHSHNRLMSKEKPREMKEFARSAQLIVAELKLESSSRDSEPRALPSTTGTLFFHYLSSRS